ncbi:uncharacterized protein LOC135846319 [Planococcus citri]|uniref:uncharacterized protein LOC135846319 n=1 Tax=Planococcus citri TaxID=170843 RepID=UPI0031F9FE94
MSNDRNFRQGFNAPLERDFFAPDELPDSALNDTSAYQIKKLHGTSCNRVETARIDLEDKNTYVPQLIPSLEDMANFAATVETLNHHYTYTGQRFVVNFDYLKHANEVIDNLMVPNPIKEKMKALCAKMEKEVRSLRSDIQRFSSVYDYYSFFYLYGLVWDSNGHIDEIKTIQKALPRSRHLNDDDFVFEIITKYCLVDYIMSFPLDSLSDEFIRTVGDRRFSEHQLTYYWIKCTLDRYDEGHYQYVLNSVKRAFSSQYQWSAYEYFWDFFNENDQVEMTMNLIRNDNYKRYLKIIFSKLNKNQLKRLYSAAPLNIIANFLSLEELELAKATWDRIKLTIECEKYELLLEHIWKNKKLQIDEGIRLQFSVYSWNTAPLNLIEYLIEVKNCQIADKFLKGNPLIENSCNFEFLKTVLSRATLEFKQKFLLQAGPCLALNHPDVFASLINHCLNETDRVTVKENLLIEAMESSPPAGIMHRFRDLFYSSREEFNEFLELFTLKPTLQTQFKECLLRSKLLITKALWKVDIWEKLTQFIDELYPNREVARYQKTNAVYTFLQIHCTYYDCYRRNGDEKFTEIDNFLNQVLTPQEVITAKENIANSFLEKCRSGWVSYLERMNMQRFASWCYCGDEENIKIFRHSLQIDKLFHRLMTEIVGRYVNSYSRGAKLSFSSLDELLRWKFSSNRREIEKFKSRKIKEIMKRKVEERFLWKTYAYPSVLKKVIEWGFHGDRRQIREFEQRYSKTDMMKIIHWMNFREVSTEDMDCCGECSDEADGARRRARSVLTDYETHFAWHYPFTNNDDVFREFNNEN